MDIVMKAEAFARKEYKKNDSFHGWKHIEAVMKMALVISEGRRVDMEILRLAIIFHDIGYHMGRNEKEKYEMHAENSVIVAEKFMRDNRYPVSRMKRVTKTILDHSTPYRKRHGDAASIEGKIIFDADKSIFITDRATYEKYFPLLYLDETRRRVKDRS